MIASSLDVSEISTMKFEGSKVSRFFGSKVPAGIHDGFAGASLSVFLLMTRADESAGMLEEILSASLSWKPEEMLVTSCSSSGCSSCRKER